jgi:polyphosphate kinase
MRSRLVEEIRRVSTAAAEGQKKTCIRLKTNALVDPTIVEELYAASAAGVPIEILARSICMLRPGVEGLSESIHVRSIVGRFLEHSRIYWFEADDQVSVYQGSGDLMPRNLDRRIEVLAPVEGARPRAEIKAILDSAFSDTTNAWELGPDGVWARVPGKGKTEHTHQSAMMRRAQVRARRARS